jgi:hypothetical protein
VELTVDDGGSQLDGGALQDIASLDRGDFICSGFDGHADSLAAGIQIFRESQEFDGSRDQQPGRTAARTLKQVVRLLQVQLEFGVRQK